MVPPQVSGLEHPANLDVFAHDTQEDRLILAMFERRPWTGGDRQLLQFEEKLNAYLSFILDGEMKDAFPHLAGKSVAIQLRTVHEPSEIITTLADRIREQLSFQGIGFEIIRIEDESDCSGGSCGCGHSH